MPIFPTLKRTATSQQVVDEFRGYNHNLKIGDGEFFDMTNLTSSYYPLLANRAKRGIVTKLTTPRALLGKSQLAYMDGSRLMYGGMDLTSYINAAGFFISTSSAMLPKQLVSMGAYIVIFPDKLYINTENYDDCGSLEAYYTTSGTVQYVICGADGTEYVEPTVSPNTPAEPEDGALWIDNRGETHVLKTFSKATGLWADIPDVYTKIKHPGIGVQFERLDGVTISGIAFTDDNSDLTPIEESLQKQLSRLNGSHIIYEKDDNYLVIVGLIDGSYDQTVGSVTVKRTVPDMDFITEASNRLWGCKYGLVNGGTVNEIYCCALGDFKNWNQFLGVATDSYVASVGTDGPWTGAVTHLGYPIFFKENCLHKVYVSSTGAHQIVDTACRGVQAGSHNSLAVVNETLFFKSVTDVCAYDGSLPVSVSEAMGTERYFNASAGALGDKYYISMEDRDGTWHLFVFDTVKGFWHREDDTHAMVFARCGGELYYIDGDTKQLKCVGCTDGDEEEDVSWMAESGLMGYITVEKKYVSRLNLRMKLPEGSEMDLYIQYDSEEKWEHIGHVEGTGTGTFMIPLRPRRCDHFRFKLEGTGDVRLYSFAKIYEAGSDE